MLQGAGPVRFRDLYSAWLAQKGLSLGTDRLFSTCYGQSEKSIKSKVAMKWNFWLLFCSKILKTMILWFVIFEFGLWTSAYEFFLQLQSWAILVKTSVLGFMQDTWRRYTCVSIFEMHVSHNFPPLSPRSWVNILLCLLPPTIYTGSRSSCVNRSVYVSLRRILADNCTFS